MHQFNIKVRRNFNTDLHIMCEDFLIFLSVHKQELVDKARKLLDKVKISMNYSVLETDRLLEELNEMRESLQEEEKNDDICHQVMI